MERSTKIYIGVGAAALVAFLLLRNKAAAQKPSGGTTGGKLGDVISGGLPKPDAPCPAGQTRLELKCIKAPCPSSMCMPDTVFNWGADKEISDHPAPPAGCRYDANYQLVCEEIYPELPTFVDDILPASMPTPNYESESYRDNMYYQNLF